MITLDLAALDAPRWVDLPRGVRVLIKPGTTPLMEAARMAAGKRLREMDEAVRQDKSLAMGLGFQILLEELGRYAITEWEGVVAPDGTALPVTPEAIAALMKHDEVGSAFFKAVAAGPDAVAAEGNASGPAPHGISATGPNTAGGAKRSARSAAGRAPTSGKRRKASRAH